MINYIGIVFFIFGFQFLQ